MWKEVFTHGETGSDKLLDRNQSEMGKAIGKVLLYIFSSYVELKVNKLAVFPSVLGMPMKP